jgi:hypothetical protein
MKQTTIIATTLILFISCALKEKGTPKYSELEEWGLSADVKDVNAYYYKSVRKNGENLIPIDKEQWDRMTITYYNKQGMLDSLKVYNSKNSSPITFIYVKEGEIIKTYLVSNSDTILYSKKYWKSEFNYIIEILNDNRVETKEFCYLDDKFRMKEIKREIYNLEDSSIEFSTGEKIYFNKNNQLDSIRGFSEGKMNDLTLNIDTEFDRNKNPIKSTKKSGEMEPYLIVREFTYY